MNGPEPVLEPFDPSTAEFIANRFPVYAKYRAADPVHWRPHGSDPERGRWCLFRHDDVSSALKSPTFGRNDPLATSTSSGVLSAYPRFERMINHWMIFKDPPDHTQIQQRFAEALRGMPREWLIDTVETLAVRSIDEISGTPGFDVIPAFASSLPVDVICALFGIEGEREDFRRWSKSLSAAIDAAPTPDMLREADETAHQLGEVLAATLRLRRKRPGQDMLSALAAQDDGADDENLIANCSFFLCAGHETTTQLIACGLLRLLRHPSDGEHLREHPDDLPRAVEEFLRLDSAVQITSRILQDDVEVGGRQMRKGQHVDLVLGSANRDPEAFPNPDAFDTTRRGAAHVAFGGGAHVCLGAALGRIEGRVAFREFLERYPDLELERPPAWRQSAVFHGVTELRVAPGRSRSRPVDRARVEVGRSPDVLA